MRHRSSSRVIPHAVLFATLFVTASGHPWPVGAQAPASGPSATRPRMDPEQLKEWLTYLASDRLQGRQVFTEGYGMAAHYVAGRLERWGVTPLGADGTYLQPVRVRRYAVTRRSSVTVDAGSESKTFSHGDHVTFSANAGGRQTLTFDGVEFVGYGRPSDYQRRDVTGRLVVTVPDLQPPSPGARGGLPGGRGGSTSAALAAGAAAAVALAPASPDRSDAEEALQGAQAALTEAAQAVAEAQQALRGNRAGGGGRGRAGRGTAPAPDLTTVQSVDATMAPQFSGDETFFEALFAGSPIPFDEVRDKALKGEPLEPMSLPARVSVTIDNTYEPVSQQVTYNVVGLVEGSDPVLKDRYVLFGAHLDHVGFNQTGRGRPGAPDACRRRSPEAQEAVKAAGRTVQRGDGRGRGGEPASQPPAFEERDFVSNGADDNASGSSALLAVAQAFATGPRPRRSVVFVWHTGEESGLYGSRYNADFPVVPLDRVEAHINMDMVGRDDCDNLEGDYSNTLFVVGADRISTDLHNIIVSANGTLPEPLTLDYELNDADDPENVYTRSDHYSYAAKGIPVAFFTTGLHPDYHRVTDTPDKIRFPKLARIAQLVYESGFAVADRERGLERDNKGPRTGFGSRAVVLD